MWKKKLSEADSVAHLFDILLKYAITSGAQEMRIEPRDSLPPQETSGFPGGASVMISMKRRQEWREERGLLQRDYSALLARLRELAKMDEAHQIGAFVLDFRDAKSGLRLTYDVKVQIEENGVASLHFAEKYDIVLTSTNCEYSPPLFFP